MWHMIAPHRPDVYTKKKKKLSKIKLINKYKIYKH